MASSAFLLFARSLETSSLQRFSTRFARLASLAIALAILFEAAPAAAVWNFTDVASVTGFNYQHGYVEGVSDEPHDYAGGVACGDYNNDGYTDLYVVRGNIGPNLLFKNRGNGTFQEVGAAAGVAVTNARGCGPAFADLNGDGWLDLVIGGIQGTAPKLFRNLGNGSFQDVTASSGVTYPFDTYSSNFGDYDKDGDLDMFLTHWGAAQFTFKHLWRNNGDFTFTQVDEAAGFSLFGQDLYDYTYVANFADINNDTWPDLLLTADFGNSEVYVNNQNGTFTSVTSAVISDDNGMGAAVGDYDNDGDLDWFVSSQSNPPYDPPIPGDTSTGNRLFRNSGGGNFTDVTDSANVRSGFWGWATSFADFNNDRYLDIFQVNGMHRIPEYDNDPSRLWVSNANGNFSQAAGALGVNDDKQGRGIACFDFDRDGDLDIFVANNSQAPLLYRNNGGTGNHYITVKLRGLPPNTEAVGGRVFVTAGGVTQMRELRAGSNYASQDPAEAHFGLGTATTVTQLLISWPNGQVDIYNGIPADHFVVFDQAGMTSVLPPGVGDPEGGGLAMSPPQNPTVGEATFRFRLDAETGVRFSIYDVSGRIVRTLVDRRQGPGVHEIVWDGTDGSGPVPAGVYLYALDALGRRATGRITLLR